MNILFVGDIFGSAGRKIVQDHLPHLVETHKAELVIANAENAAGGFGLTPAIAEDLFTLGCDVITTGNHVWDKREIMDYLSAGANGSNPQARRVLRPGNYSDAVPGCGVFEGSTRSGKSFAVIHLQGRVFMNNADDPFRKVDVLLEGIKSKVIILDFHAEATSEKVAMGWYLDGRVTAVLGTHTHIPTADTTILPKGTAYQTDIGMSGPYDSVIGVVKEQILHRFLTGLPSRFEAAKGDPRFCGVVINCDETSGRAHSIQRLMLGE
ncbi:MAG TPA: TIGR00282 family metallophosphoesterase [Alphaproteobacteria bacterium]|nr:TIGR00282 family metallophosphoesterase [Alphaproteobacteria bacterium]